MDDWDDGVGLNLREIPPFVNLLVDFADDRDVVAAKDVKAENNLELKIVNDFR